MIYALKLLVAVFVLTCVAAYVFRAAFKDLFNPVEYKRVWTLVLMGVAASYLCKFPALFLLAVGAIALYGAAVTGRGPVGKVSIYLLFALTLPPISQTLGGFGGINYVLSLDHLRIVSMLLLSWAAVELAGMKPVPRQVKFFWIDVLVVAYQCLKLFLSLPHSSMTNVVRVVVEAVLDVLLPYFVISRSLRSMADLRFAAGHILIGLVFMASVGVLETLLQHNLYSGLQGIYDVRWGLTYGLMRGGLIRVQATTQAPIILAFVMLFAIAIGYWLKGHQWRRGAVAALFGAVLIVLVATFSRGPWLAAGLMVFALVAMRRLSVASFRVLLIAVVVAAIGIKMARADQAVMAALGAMFGSTDADLSSIEYRRELLDTSLELIKQSPWLGVPNYAAQMQSLRQGEGIIDIVNSYVGIMLDSGLIGLTIYVLPFLIVLNRLLSAIRRGAGGVLEAGARFPVAFVALILGSLFAIFTTSTWGVMALLMTLLLALPSAWLALSPDERNADGVRADIELDIPDSRRRRFPIPAGARFS